MKTLLERIAYLEAQVEELKNEFPPIKDGLAQIASVVGGIDVSISRNDK